MKIYGNMQMATKTTTMWSLRVFPPEYTAAAVHMNSSRLSGKNIMN
jgi:hypothetical protein